MSRFILVAPTTDRSSHRDPGRKSMLAFGRTLEGLNMSTWRAGVRELASRDFAQLDIDAIRPLLGALLPGGLVAIRMEYQPGVNFVRICRHPVTAIKHALALPAEEVKKWSRCGAPETSLLYLGASREVCRVETPIEDLSQYFVVQYMARKDLAFAALLGWPHIATTSSEQLDKAIALLDGISTAARLRFREIMLTVLDALVGEGMFSGMPEASSHHLSASVAQCLLVHPEAHGFTWPSVRMKLRGQCFALRGDEQDRLTIERITRVDSDGGESEVYRDGKWVQ